MDNGINVYVSRAIRRVIALIGSRSLHITKTITRLPTSLVSRLKAMLGKSDQQMLNRQYVMKRRTGQQ